MKRPEKLLANDLLELEVLDLGAGTSIGSIVDFAMTREGQVVLIGILSEQWFRGGQGVAPSAVTNVNNERITIVGADSLVEFCPDGEELFSVNSDSFILNKTVMLDDGEMLGSLQDFCFSLEDGQVTDLIVLDKNQKRVKVPVESFKTIGRDYIVIIPGAQSFDATDEVAAIVEPEAQTNPVSSAGKTPGTSQDDVAADVGIPPAAGSAGEAPPPPTTEPTREEEKDALFGNGIEKAKLSKFDQKKREFLCEKAAHRDIADADGNLIVAKGGTFDDVVLEQIIAAGLLGDIFIELA